MNNSDIESYTCVVFRERGANIGSADEDDAFWLAMIFDFGKGRRGWFPLETSSLHSSLSFGFHHQNLLFLMDGFWCCHCEASRRHIEGLLL